MKAIYIKNIYDWAQGLGKENTEIALSKLTKEPEQFERALQLLYNSGHNCGIVEGDSFVYKAGVKPARVKISPARALLLVEAGVLKQCPPKRGAFMLFPSGTALEIKTIAKGWLEAAKHFEGEVETTRYTNKEIPLNGNLFIIDYPLFFD